MYEKQRLVFMKMTSLITTLNSMNFQDDLDTTKLLDKLVLESKDIKFPLPSGCVGNALALALEMHMFKGAVYLIVNADRLGIDLENTSMSMKFRVPYNAKLIFEYAIKNEPYLEEDFELDKFNTKESIDVIKKMLI